MAVEWAVEHKRSNTYLFLPEDIQLDPDRNGRHDIPPIDDMVASLLRFGQRTPVEIRRGEKGQPILVAGHTRWRAARHINAKKLAEVPFQLECVYARVNAQTGFMHAIIENHHRNDCTPMDDAHNIQKLMNCGQTEEQIAEVYNKDAAWVRTRIKLLELEPEVQKAVAEKRVKPTAAKHLAKLSAAAQRDAVKGTNRVKLADVAPARKSRTIKETVETLDKINGPGVSKKGRLIVQMLISYLQGEVSEKNFVDNFTEAVG